MSSSFFLVFLWNESKWWAYFLSSSASTRHLHSITMERNEKRREDRLHVWTRCVHPILLVKVSRWIPDLLANLRISNATHLTTCLALFSSLALPGSSSLSFSQTYPKSFGSSDHCSRRGKKSDVYFPFAVRSAPLKHDNGQHLICALACPVASIN